MNQIDINDSTIDQTSTLIVSTILKAAEMSIPLIGIKSLKKLYKTEEKLGK